MEIRSKLFAPFSSESQLIDRILVAISGVLAVAVVGSAAYLGYSVLQQRAMERAADPAMRVVDGVSELVAESPNDPQLRVRLGEALASAGRFREAVRELNAALEISPDHTGAHLVLGIVAMMQQDYDTANSYFLRVLEVTEGGQFEGLKEHRELAFFYLGESALDTGHYEEAVGYFKAAIRMNRANADFYFGLGMALKGIEELAGALENYEIALVFDPKFAQAHYEMGQVYLMMDDRINAAVHFAEAAKLDPDNDLPPEALASLGTAAEWEARAREALQAGDTDAALEAVLILRVLEPEDVDKVVLHAEIVEAMDKPDIALELYQEALEMAPENEGIKAAMERLKQE